MRWNNHSFIEQDLVAQAKHKGKLASKHNHTETENTEPVTYNTTPRIPVFNTVPVQYSKNATEVACM